MSPNAAKNSGPPVAIVGGTGALGFGLALRLAKAGTPVVIGSRDPDRARERATEAVKQASEPGDVTAITGLSNTEAAAAGQIVFLTVPFKAQQATLDELKSALRSGSVLVDATAPLETAIGGKPTRSIGVWQGSAAEQARSAIPDDIAVVSALHTVSAKSLQDLDHSLQEDTLICGDDAAAKQALAELLGRVPGLRPVDCGPLEMARITEQLTPLLISVNKRYKTKHSGLAVTGLPAQLWTSGPSHGV